MYTKHIWINTAIKHANLKVPLGYVTIGDPSPLQMSTKRAMSCNQKHCRSTRESGS